jgi:hypothetical protein
MARSGRVGAASVSAVAVLLGVVALSSCTGATGGQVVSGSGGGGAVVGGVGMTPATPAPSPPSPAAPGLDPSTVLTWASGSLPSGFAGAVAALPGVRHVVSVFGGTVWMTRSIGADGATVDRPSSPFAIPIDLAAADPTAYAPFVPAAQGWMTKALAAGSAVLGSTSATLRHLGEQGALAFGSRDVAVAGVVPDQTVGAAEVFVSARTARTLGVTIPRWLLIQPQSDTPFDRLETAIRDAAPAGTPLVVRAYGQTPYLRYGDAVLAPALEKSAAGEFAAYPEPSGSIVVDPTWVKANIETAAVPILGRVTCNRVLFPMLRAALAQVVQEGLSNLVDPNDYAGCYVPRFIGRTSDRPLSHHAWGTALDINVSHNPMGGTPHQDPRLVAIFEQHGFTWGGRWVVPDGMHFELHQVPPPG